MSFPFILFQINSYQLSHAIFLLHFLLQLFETLLHALMERSQVVCYSLPMQRDSSTKQRDLHMKIYDVNRTNIQKQDHKHGGCPYIWLKVLCTCHAMRSLSRRSFSRSSGCCSVYSSVKNAWRRRNIQDLVKEYNIKYQLQQIAMLGFKFKRYWF